MVDLADLPDAVVVLDADRRITAANDGVATLTGHRPDALVGRSCADALDPRGRDGERLLERGWHRSASLRSVRSAPEQEVLIRRPDGRDVHAGLTARYLRDADGALTGAVLVLRPTSLRGNRVPSGIEIVSTVSHELRSPLTSVKGYTSLLLNRWDRLKDDQKRMMLEQVHHDADRVTRLVTELLDISRIETGRLVLRRDRIDLREILASVVEKLQFDHPGLAPTAEFPDDFPKVFADPDKVEQVMLNLVENAVKYATPEGLWVVGAVEADRVRLSVVDRGEGIPSADLNKVFNKFFRRAETKPTGSGLGLWISRGLVEGHGGRLTATSVMGEGSTFSFTLPIKAPEELLDG